MSDLTVWAQFWVTPLLMLGVTTLMVVIVVTATAVWLRRNGR